MATTRRESENREKFRLGGELVRFGLNKLDDAALWGLLDEARSRARDSATVATWQKRGATFQVAPRTARKAVIVTFPTKPPVEALAQLRRYSLHYNSVRREWSGRVALDHLAALRELTADLGGTMEELADAVARGRSKELVQVSLPHALTPDEARDLHRLGLRWSPSLCLFEGMADLQRVRAVIKRWNGRAEAVTPGQMMDDAYPVDLSVKVVTGARYELVWPHPPAPEIVEQLSVLGAEVTSATTASLEVNGNIRVLERLLCRDYGDPELREVPIPNTPS